MEVFGKVIDIVTSRKGTSQATGNPYEIQTVAVAGSDNVCFEVFGTIDHLAKHGMVKGAEGKFIIKTETNFFNGKYYQRNTLENIRNDFKPLGGMPAKPLVEDSEASQQIEVAAKASQAAKDDTKDNSKQPAPTDDLPF